jgi:hypothetical protein
MPRHAIYSIHREAHSTSIDSSHHNHKQWQLFIAVHSCSSPRTKPQQPNGAKYQAQASVGARRRSTSSSAEENPLHQQHNNIGAGVRYTRPTPVIDPMDRFLVLITNSTEIWANRRICHHMAIALMQLTKLGVIVDRSQP